MTPHNRPASTTKVWCGLVALLAMAAFPGPALANMGTPLLWLSFLHLLFGNAIIGIVEGLILARLLRCSADRAIMLLIIANYASAWLGGVLLLPALSAIPDITVENVRLWFLAMLVLAFLLTLLIEYPFFWLSAPAAMRPWRGLLPAVMKVHGISYGALVVLYLLASGTSLVTRARVVSINELSLPAEYRLYFINQAGDRVLHAPLNDPASAETLRDIRARHRNDRLFTRPRADGGFDLLMYFGSDNHNTYHETPILEDFASVAPIEWRMTHGDTSKGASTWFNAGEVPNIGGESDWEFFASFWPVGGLGGENTKTGERARLALESPFFMWPFRNAVQLRGEIVVAQIGNDQIAAMHLPSRRIALLARGKGPIVAVPKPPGAALPLPTAPVEPAP
jgi:hypothetical protein